MWIHEAPGVAFWTRLTAVSGFSITQGVLYNRGSQLNWWLAQEKVDKYLSKSEQEIWTRKKDELKYVFVYLYSLPRSVFEVIILFILAEDTL